MDDPQGKYAKNKNPDLTYISKVVGERNNIRYVSKVFDLHKFKDYYYEQKSKKVFEVIRESSKQEITAIYDQDTTGFGIRIQRFSKDTGAPQNQSFSFHGGALARFLKFIESLDLLDLRNTEKFKVTDKHIDELIQKKKSLNDLLNRSKPLSKEQLIRLFDNLEQPTKNALLDKFIENIDQYEAENLGAAIRQREHKNSLQALKNLLDLHDDSDFVSKVQHDDFLKVYAANQPEKIFNNWIGNNLWIFGAEYFKRHKFHKIGADSSQADIVLETGDGFLSLIEIKRPIAKSKLLRYDQSHRCFFPAHDLSVAIGQCLVYLQRVEDFKKDIESKNPVRVLRPRIKLIIGRTSDSNSDEKEALHFINSSLHDIEVISYDQLVEFGNRILSFFESNK